MEFLRKFSQLFFITTLVFWFLGCLDDTSKMLKDELDVTGPSLMDKYIGNPAFLISDNADNPVKMVKDINPNENSSYIYNMVKINNTLYFIADDGTHGEELWKSDGTEQGTVLVRDINPGENSSVVYSGGYGMLLNNNGVIQNNFYFTADDGTHGEELWKSDGTEQGTVLVKDINLGAHGSGIENYSNSNSVFYFTADNGVNGSELWKSDGTTQGTVFVKDINIGANDSWPANLLFVNNNLFFVASNGVNGKELWKSDGTTQGTVLVNDLSPGEGCGFTFPPTNCQPLESFFSNFISFKNLLFFVSTNNSLNGNRGLYASNGTADGTIPVIELPREENGNANSWSEYPIYPEPGSGYILKNKMILFVMEDYTDSSDNYHPYAYKLWVSDGTPAGTKKIDDQLFDAGTYLNVAVAQDVIYFSTFDDNGVCSLWKSDGTKEGTKLVKKMQMEKSSELDLRFTTSDNFLFFRGYDAEHGWELWKSDGTSEGTKIIYDINEGTAHSYPSQLIKMGDYLYFSALNTINGKELWRYKINSYPTIAHIPDCTLTGEKNNHLSITVGDRDTNPENLTVTVISGDQTVIANENITIEKNGAERIISIMPANINAETTVTVIVSDGDLTTKTSFTVQVVECSLRATVTPSDTLIIGARFRIDNGDWQLPNTTISYLTAGYHTIEFNKLPGYKTPEARTFRVLNYKTVVIDGVYKPLPDYNISAIPPQHVEAGRNIRFLFHSEELGQDATLSVSTDTAGDHAEGDVQFDSQSREFTYTPSKDDKQPFEMEFRAIYNDGIATQTVTFYPANFTKSEQDVIGYDNLSQMNAEEVVSSQDKDYLIQKISTSDDKKIFNELTYGKTTEDKDGKEIQNPPELVGTAQPIQTKTVDLVGKTIVFEKGNPNGLYESYNDVHDIEFINIYAETVIIKNYLRFPGTTVAIYARELRFEDKNDTSENERACIDTTPVNIPTGPAFLIKDALSVEIKGTDGAPGQKAGDINIFIEKYLASPTYAVRFIMNGGNGQPAGIGKSYEGSQAFSPLPVFEKDGGSYCTPYPSNTTYIDERGVSSNQGTTLWPANGRNGVPAGKPGNAGDGGTLIATNNLTAAFMNKGGIAGVKGSDTKGEKAGTPSPAYSLKRKKDCTGMAILYCDPSCYSVTGSSTTIDGADSVAPGADIQAGKSGQMQFNPRSLSWLHPAALKVIIAHAKETYRQGFAGYAQKVLTEYSDIISLYASHPEWEALPEQWQLDFSQMHDEMQVLLHRIASGLDYYGNPAGWVPMLSFEANQLAFEKEVDSAIRTLYLSYWIKNSSNTIEQRVNSLMTAMSQLQQDNDGYYEKYAIATQLIRNMEVKVDQVSNDILSAQLALESLEKKLMFRANMNVEDRKKGPAWAQFCRFFGGALKSVPMYQPYVGMAGSALDTIANAGTKSWSELQKLPDAVFNYKQDGAVEKAERARKELEKINYEEIKKMGTVSYLKKVVEVVKPLGGAVRDMAKSMQDTKVPQDELMAEFNTIKANDTEFIEMTAKVEDLLNTKQGLMEQLNAAMQDVSTFSNNIMNNIISMNCMSNEVALKNKVLDVRAKMYLDEMERRAKERLLKYYYYMVKAYEYRLLKPYEGNLNLNSLFEKMKKIAEETDTDHTLNAAEFDSLKALYEEQVSSIAESIFSDYNQNRPERSVPVRFNLPVSILNKLNTGEEVVINLMDLGIFMPSEENIRIVNLNIVPEDFKATVVNNNTQTGGVQFAYCNLEIEHSGISKFSKDGKDYLFRHYNKNTVNPIVWGVRYDALSRSLDVIAPSVASDSMIRTLLNRQGIPLEQDTIIMYSRPAAWADIILKKKVHSNNGMDIVLQNVKLEVIYDYSQKNSKYVNLRIAASNHDIAPYFIVDKADINLRKDGNGSFCRTYQKSSFNTVHVSAPSRFMYWRFERWTDAFGNSIPISILPNSSDHTIEIPLDKSYALCARYFYDSDGDTLSDDWELKYFGSLKNGANDDTDHDGLTNAQEYQLGLDPTNADTDGDYMPDGWEVAHGLDPHKKDAAEDKDNDGVNNLQEFIAKTDPGNNSSIPSAFLVEDFETGDFTKIPWGIKGSPRMVMLSSNYVTGGSNAVQMSNVPDNGNVFIETSIYCNAGQVSFWYALDSEKNGDYLRFYIDDKIYGKWSGQIDYTLISYEIPKGLHRFRWEYRKNKVLSAGLDSAWIDDITFPGGFDSDGDRMADAWEIAHNLNPLANDALVDNDNDGFCNIWEYAAQSDPQKGTSTPEPKFTSESFENITNDIIWKFGGDAIWARTSNNPYKGSRSLQTPVLENSQQAFFETDLYCEKGDISFYLAVDTEEEYDFISFYIDDNIQGEWSGNIPYTFMNYKVKVGRHTFRWEYIKDGSGSSGSDAIWVDEIVFPGIYDTDSDGMPDSWEIKTNLNPLVSDAYEDPNNDNIINIDEFKNMTNPLDK